MKCLDHPNIAQTFTIGNGQLTCNEGGSKMAQYIEMELVDGPMLYYLISDYFEDFNF